MDYNGNGVFAGNTMHCTVPLADSTVGRLHPFKNAAAHEKLLEYLRSRLHAGRAVRDSQLDRLVRIDKNIAGWMIMSEDDQKRDREKERTGTPTTTMMNLPLAYVHIDDMMTYFAETFAPNRGMFYHTGKPDEVQEANQIVTLMNNHALYGGFYRQILLGIYSILKYNLGGYRVFWSQEQGPKLTRQEDQTDRLDLQLKWQGNKLEAIDRYNFLYDNSVHPTELHSQGEFAATAFIKSHYWLQNKASQGVYFNCADALALNQTNVTCKYYRHPPSEAQFDQNNSNNSGTNWVSVLSASTGYDSNAGYELVELFIRLNPNEFNLLPRKDPNRNRYETWKFTVLNDTWIIEAQYMNNIHGYLPFFLGLLNDDSMGAAQKSASEIIQPLQEFASFLANTHLLANRSNLFGLQVYDPSVMDLASIKPGEVNARVPIKPAGYGRPVKEAIWERNSTLETKQTLGDLEGVMGLISQFFPTQALPSQIASIDRAVTNQVAAVQHGANRRQQKAARLLDDSVFRNIRAAMYYNIIQYQPDESEVMDYYTGKPVKIDLGALRNTDLPYIIGQGLKSIDRQAAAQSLQQIIFALIQAPAAAERIDILGLLDYWTSMMDIEIDLTQFALPEPPAAPAAPGGVAESGAGNLTPAADPSNITDPVY